MKEMEFSDTVFWGLEREDGTGSKSSIDMSWLIQKLKVRYSVEKKTKDYYIVTSDNRRLHLIWRYNSTGNLAWTASDIADEDKEKIRNGNDKYILVLIRYTRGKEDPAKGSFRYSLQEERNAEIDGKNKRISSGTLDPGYADHEKKAQSMLEMMRDLFDVIDGKMGE